MKPGRGIQRAGRRHGHGFASSRDPHDTTRGYRTAGYAHSCGGELAQVLRAERLGPSRSAACRPAGNEYPPLLGNGPAVGRANEQPLLKPSLRRPPKLCENGPTGGLPAQKAPIHVRTAAAARQHPGAGPGVRILPPERCSRVLSGPARQPVDQHHQPRTASLRGGWAAGQSCNRNFGDRVRIVRSRTFAVGNATTFLMTGAIFVAGFLVTQEFRLGRGYSPVSAGVRLLPFLATPMFISPIAGAVSDRIGRPSWRLASSC